MQNELPGGLGRALPTPRNHHGETHSPDVAKQSLGLMSDPRWEIIKTYRLYFQFFNP